MQFVIMTPNRKAQLEALGRIVEAMSNVELNVMLSFSMMAKIEIGVIQSMLAGESIGKILAMLESVFAYKVKDEQLLKPFSLALDKLRKSIKARNDIMHSILFVSDAESIHRLKISKGGNEMPVKWDPVDVDINGLNKIADDIMYANQEFIHFFTQHFTV
ncbi:MAG: hypothetical protein WDA22_17605 [Bacteroidota bacterium]